eukprot:6111337-Pleurochrysis_carterae.AAC.1
MFNARPKATEQAVARRGILSDDRRQAICCVSLRCNYEGVGNIGKFKVEAVLAIGMCKNIPGLSLVCTFPVALITHSPLYTDNAKPPKDPSDLRAECELRQQGARRRDRDL